MDDIRNLKIEAPKFDSNLKSENYIDWVQAIESSTMMKRISRITLVTSSYVKELYLKITSLSQENLKVEEYIWEFDQFQLRVGLNEDEELTITRFIKKLSPSIANKVERQPYLTVDDVCNLPMKIERQLNGRKSIRSPASNHPQGFPKSFSSLNKVNTTPTPINTLDKGKRIASEPPKRLEGKKCFKCHGHEHFQADCPNQRTLTIKQLRKSKLLARFG